MANNKLTAADVWRKAGRQRRFNLGVPQLLPSGVKVKLCRPEFEVWYGSDRLPSSLANDVALVFGKETEEDMAQALMDLGEEKSSDVLEFLHRITKEAVVGVYVLQSAENSEEQTEVEMPIVVVDRLSEEAPEDTSEMLLADISNEDQATILAIVLDSIPSQPVKTLGGGVTMDSLRNFRPGDAGASGGTDSGEVSPSA